MAKVNLDSVIRTFAHKWVDRVPPYEVYMVLPGEAFSGDLELDSLVEADSSGSSGAAQQEQDETFTMPPAPPEFVSSSPGHGTAVETTEGVWVFYEASRTVPKQQIRGVLKSEGDELRALFANIEPGSSEYQSLMKAVCRKRRLMPQQVGGALRWTTCPTQLRPDVSSAEGDAAATSGPVETVSFWHHDF